MQNRPSVAADARPAVPDFTPERQRAFIDALADTGSVRWSRRVPPA